MEISQASDLNKDALSRGLVEALDRNSDDWNLVETNVYYDFPLYRDEEAGGLISTKVLVVSKQHGVVIFGTSSASDVSASLLHADNEALEQVFSNVYARLIKNRKLRKGKQDLAMPIEAAIFAPSLTRTPTRWNVEDTALIWSEHGLEQLFASMTWGADDELYAEVIATLEGAKGLIRPTKRETDELKPNSKGVLASRLESEIATFDQRQKKAALRSLDGPQRVRGLAGSGKTVVLAMKAALIHLREPEATILYAFWTKSLYQHVRRLITRFYRQFEDRDPDWDRLRVMHGWGGASLEGVYSTAATAAGVKPLTFQEASLLNRSSPFEAACEQLLRQSIKPLYDYVLIDEGQDYPPSFIKLCARLASKDRFVIAYDELQNIFQTKLPAAQDILGGESKEFAEDLVLHKCYRNPREVLVCAHAVGFGLYTDHIVQMLENKEHWEDIGYKVIQGTFIEGSPTIIERPPENSLQSVSANQRFDEIVKLHAVASLDDEVTWVVDSIVADIADGLRPEDILVITVDDRNAKTYLNSVAMVLHAKRIASLNVHGPFGDSDFQREGSVTLSTVHKAKGNEAMMVYVVGADALYPRPSIRQRNMLFASMTRAKAWLRVSGISPAMDSLVQEVSEAKRRFPNLVFDYPSPAQISIMRRDLEDSASKRLTAERLLEEVSGSMSEEEFEAVLQRFRSGAAKKSKGKGSKRNAP